MKKLRQSEFRAFLALGFLSLFAMGTNCQQDVPTTNTSGVCDAGTAQIAVWDGYLQRVCGCGGMDGEIFAPPAALNCTLAIGTTVYVHYHGPLLTHQIVPVGTPEIPIGPVFDPSFDNSVPAYGFTPTATGTYQFKNMFQEQMTGSFTVTP